MGATTAPDRTRPGASASSARPRSPPIRVPSVTNSHGDSDDDAKAIALHQSQGKAANTRDKAAAGAPRASGRAKVESAETLRTLSGAKAESRAGREKRGAPHASTGHFSAHLATREANMQGRPIPRDDLLPRNTWHFFDEESEANLVVTDRLERRRRALGIHVAGR